MPDRALININAHFEMNEKEGIQVDCSGLVMRQKHTDAFYTMSANYTD